MSESFEPMLMRALSASGLSPVSWDTGAATRGCRVYRGFDELDGFADELVWDRAVAGRVFPGLDAVERAASYRWALLVGDCIIDYCEGDVTLVVAPSREAARVEWDHVVAFVEA